MLQSIFNSRLSIHLIIRHSIYPVGIITRYKLCATTDSQKVELTMKTPLITREGYEKLKETVKQLSRKAILEKSLENYGYILVADSMEDAIETANAIASEHLEIVTKNPFEVMTKIQNAGAIFMGEYSSEPLGDYFAGPNHVLPTNGTAKFFSPLSVDDFVKKSSIIYYSREALQPIHKDIEQFAKCEQLTAHANSIAVRFEGEE